jgi:hypothetical protein
MTKLHLPNESLIGLISASRDLQLYAQAQQVAHAPDSMEAAACVERIKASIERLNDLMAQLAEVGDE